MSYSRLAFVVYLYVNIWILCKLFLMLFFKMEKYYVCVLKPLFMIELIVFLYTCVPVYIINACGIKHSSELKMVRINNYILVYILLMLVG